MLYYTQNQCDNQYCLHYRQMINISISLFQMLINQFVC